MTTPTPTPTRDDVIALARSRMTSEYLATLRLRQGTGTGEPGDACLIQAERWELRRAALDLGAAELAEQYDPKSDACPPCTSPICRTLGIQVQDARAEWRAECVALLPLLPGSAGSPTLETKRLYRLIDCSVREALPAIVDVLADALAPHDAGVAEALRGHAGVAADPSSGAPATGLRGLLPIADDASWRAAAPSLRALALALAHAHALAHARALDLAHAHALDLAHAHARALDLALALAHALDLALDLAHARALDLALALAHARALARAPITIPSPVALLRELLEMRDP
jgi:hypothetical protein